MTNVPGPTRPLYLAGDRLTNFMFWVPAAGSVGMGISILSYAGTVMVGIMTDVGLVPDPTKIAENFNAELREMHERLVHELPADSFVQYNTIATMRHATLPRGLNKEVSHG